MGFGRDLESALTIGPEAIEAARRSGVREAIDTATANYLLSLWTAGLIAEAVEVHRVSQRRPCSTPADGSCSVRSGDGWPRRRDRPGP